MNLESLPHKELRSARTGEVFSLSAVLTDALGFKDLFIHHDIIPPGHRASSSHAHSHREEMVLVLSGEVTARIDKGTVQLRAGDFLGFSPGQTHVVENTGSATAKILVIASNPPADRVITAG